MYFQTIDDKKECVGVYQNGQLFFDQIPSELGRTWKYSGTLESSSPEYAWLYCGGISLEAACPESLKEEYESAAKKMRAYRRSFELAKVDLHEHCFFDLVPHDFIVRFLEVKNKITEHIFQTCEKPTNYKFLNDVQRLLHQIKYQSLLLNGDECREIFVKSILRKEAQKYLTKQNHIDYNLFGTVTGRLTTKPSSFPILTMRKELRKLVKPRNDWFLSLDYNGAEVRTLLALSGNPQPLEDIHSWNLVNVLERADIPREEAKTIFFAWLYNPDSQAISTDYYDREKVLDKWYHDGYINTVFGREIKVDRRRALNYLIQSTTSDLVLERACRIGELLKDKKSFISHIVHDEVVVDLDNEERELVPEIKEIFANNTLGKYLVNLSAGPNYLELNELKL
jgi:DNA polymerase I-like protein with 3'-5' exonuclease and polymerase domains